MIKIARRRKKFKLSKKKLIRFIILLTIIIVTIIVYNVVKIDKMIKENENDPIARFEYQNPRNFEEALEKNEIKYFEKEYNENEEYSEYKVEFKHDLYEDGEKQEKYFDDLVKDLSKYINQDFKLVDQKKKIEIYVKKDRTSEMSYIINDRENYFQEDDNIKILDSYKKIEPVDERIYHSEINQISSVDWDLSKTSRKNLILDENGNFITKDNIIIEMDRTFTKRIVFDANYEKSIINGIKVGTKFEKIKEELGDPTFTNDKLNMIGYKLNEEYIFFYEDKVVLYPNIEFNNKNFEDELFSFYEGETNLSRSRFSNKILNKYKDFEASIKEDVLILKSITRQIEIKIDKNLNMEITVYNNYNLGNKMKKYIRDNEVIPKLNEDYVYINEINSHY